VLLTRLEDQKGVDSRSRRTWWRSTIIVLLSNYIVTPSRMRLFFINLHSNCIVVEKELALGSIGGAIVLCTCIPVSRIVYMPIR